MAYQKNYLDYCTGKNCSPLNATRFVLNTTNSSACTVVEVSCVTHYQLVPSDHVYVCTSGMWMPLAPQCVATVYDNNVGIIVGCTVGAVVCLLIVAMAIYMQTRTNKKEKERLDRDRMQDDKMKRIRDFVTSTTQDDARSTFEDDIGIPQDISDDAHSEDTNTYTEIDPPDNGIPTMTYSEEVRESVGETVSKLSEI